MYKGPIDMDGLFSEDKSFEQTIGSFLDAIKTVLDAVSEAKEDTIHTSIGQFVVMTCPNPIDGGYDINVGVCDGLKDGEIQNPRGPVLVEHCESQADSERLHREWLKFIIDTPPMVLKDIKTRETIYAG